MNNDNIEKITWDIIPGEIKNDLFYDLIIKLIEYDNSIKNILEIGASSGDCSTEAFMKGKIKNKNIKLFSIEVCTERFNVLKNRYKNDESFYPYNVSSINIKSFPSKEKVSHFYNTTQTILNRYELNDILGWYDNDIKYITVNRIPEDGINLIKKEHNITNFDCVLIDGSEFTGVPELELVYGAKYILLDDIYAFKNYETHMKLKGDKNYRCLVENYSVRHGFSIFVKN